MAKKRFDGPKYKNGNHKEQQKAYNRTEHGLKIRVAANEADRKSKASGKGKKGDGKDNAHYPGSNRSRLMSASRNRGTERRKPRTA